MLKTVDIETMSLLLKKAKISVNSLLGIDGKAPSRTIDEACEIFSKLSKEKKRDKKIKLVEGISKTNKELVNDLKKMKTVINLTDEKIIAEMQASRRQEVIEDNKQTMTHLKFDSLDSIKEKVKVPIKLKKLNHVRSTHSNEIFSPPKKLMLPSKLSKNPSSKMKIVPMDTTKSTNLESKKIITKLKRQTTLIDGLIETKFSKILEGPSLQSMSSFKHEKTKEGNSAKGSSPLIYECSYPSLDEKATKIKVRKEDIKRNVHLGLGSFTKEAKKGERPSFATTFTSNMASGLESWGTVDSKDRWRPTIEEREDQRETRLLTENVRSLVNECIGASTDIEKFKIKANGQLNRLHRRLRANARKLDAQSKVIEADEHDKEDFEKFKTQRDFKKKLMSVMSSQIEQTDKTFIALKEKETRARKQKTVFHKRKSTIKPSLKE